MSKKGTLIYTALAGILLLALYCIIFCFSAQDAETSGSISLKVSQMGIDFWNNLVKRGWNEEIRLEWALYFEHPIRKMAHFAEYALMGFLQYSILRCNFGKSKKFFWAAVVWTSVSAAADEVHQLFVPGRWGSLADVLLDTCGGITGILCCMCIVNIYKKLKNNRAKRA